MYTGRLIENLIKAVERCEQEPRAAKPVTVKMASRVEIGRAEMQAFFYQMHESGMLQAGIA